MQGDNKILVAILCLMLTVQLMVPSFVSAADTKDHSHSSRSLTETSDASREFEESYVEEHSAYPFWRIRFSWKLISDERLNEYIKNNNMTEIAKFYYSLSERDRAKLLKRNTMLTEITEYEDEEGKRNKTPYYKLILKQVPEIQLAASGYTTTSGYCYYAFYYSSSDYVRYKVDFSISSPSKISASTGPGFTMNYTVAQSSGSNMKNIVNARFSKNMSTMQRALTKNAKYGSSTSKTNSRGERIYKTKYNEVFVLDVSYVKPACMYYNAEFDSCVSNQRFNFRNYSWDNESSSTLEKGVYHSNHRETVTSQVNMRNTGIDTAENRGGTAHGVGRLVFDHPTLNIRYNKNSASATGSSPVTGSRPYDRTKRTLKSVMASCGFSWPGHYIDVSAAWKNSGAYWGTDRDYRADEIEDFYDGEYFTSKSKPLYANWKKKDTSGPTPEPEPSPNPTPGPTPSPDPDPTPDPTPIQPPAPGPYDGFWIFFNANGGDGVPGFIRTYSTANLSPYVPKREGYRFMGWSGKPEWSTKRAAYAGGMVAKDGSVTTTSGDWTRRHYEIFADMTFYNVGSDPTYAGFLYAQWEKDDENEPPKIVAPDRTFFLHETVDEKELLKRVKVTDKEDGDIDSSKYTELKITTIKKDGTKSIFDLNKNGLLDTSDEKVTYEVFVKYKDSGNATAEKTFKVSISKAPNSAKEAKTYPRFINLKMINTLDAHSIWRVNSRYNSTLTDSLEREQVLYSYDLFSGKKS